VLNLNRQYITGDFKQSIRLALWFTGLIWLIWSLGELLDLELYRFGVYPGSYEHITGVLTAPLIHGSLAHITSNTLPLLVMLALLFYAYPRSSLVVLIVLYLGSGLIVWVIGRHAWHYGASGMTHGLMFFLFVIGILRRDALAAAFAMIVFFLYGGMVWGIFPRDPEISFEYHLAGAILGILMAFLLRNYDRRLPEKRYDWEGEDDEDGIIGDEWKSPDP
jgi:membrane associated rhomboid family serine protease